MVCTGGGNGLHGFTFTSVWGANGTAASAYWGCWGWEE